MTKKRYMALALGLATATALATSAGATIVVANPSDQNDGNVLCNQGGVTGTSIECFVGSTGITFTTLNNATLIGSGGQAVVTGGSDGGNGTLNLDNVKMFATLGATFGFVEFNLKPAAGVVVITVTDAANVDWVFSTPVSDFTLGNGQNRFAFQSTSGALIKSVTVDTQSGDGIGAIRQLRWAAEPPAPSVPEPATWAMMLLGFGMIGFAARRARQTMRVTYS